MISVEWADMPECVASTASDEQAAECRRSEELILQSARCRRLADNIGDPATAAILRSMAQEYEVQATAFRG